MSDVVVAAQLAKEEWYHGLLPREDIKMMLRKTGDFLVRCTEPNKGQPRAFVISVQTEEKMEEDGIRHYIINMLEGKYIVERQQFVTVSALIHHHQKSKESLVRSTKAVLLHSVGRQTWELNHTDVELTKKLGEGAFGEVHMGKLKKKKVNVAVKLAKLESLTKDQIKEIMSEARLMRNFSHPNVVRFYGVAAGQEPLMVVMELASCGALDSYLQKNALSIEKKNEMVVQAAWGLEYIHGKSVLHRDIAARNCLYGDGNVKISDFGLSRQGTVYQMDPGKRVPIRWLAPETLKTAIYTQKTDVFSFGILCWEIYSDGQEPYPYMSVADVCSQVKEGYRMVVPLAVCPAVSKIIRIHCWTENPNERYTMGEVTKHLQRSLAIKKASGGVLASMMKSRMERSSTPRNKSDARTKSKSN